MRFVALLALLISPALAGVGGDEVMYVSGTIHEIPKNTTGQIFMPTNREMQFRSSKGGVVIPITRLTSAVYLEKRAEGSSSDPAKLKLPLLPGIPVPKAFRDGKQRSLTLIYTDKEGYEQKIVLLVAKKMVGPLIHLIETHGAKEVTLDPTGDYTAE